MVSDKLIRLSNSGIGTVNKNSTINTNSHHQHVNDSHVYNATHLIHIQKREHEPLPDIVSVSYHSTEGLQPITPSLGHGGRHSVLPCTKGENQLDISPFPSDIDCSVTYYSIIKPSYGLVFKHDKLLGLRPRVYHLSHQT